MANILFGNPRHMSIYKYRSQNVPFTGRVDPFQLTDYTVCVHFSNKIENFRFRKPFEYFNIF